jgi:hypothetical protein
LAPLVCTSCHVDDEKYSFLLPTCAECHGDHDREFMVRHLQDFGENCVECHDGVDRMVNFDHSTTDFPLIGKHVETRCVNCHVEGKFANTPLDCKGCHEEPAIHEGVFTQDCSSCHDSHAWVPALLEGEMFDHSAQTTFSLIQHAQDFNGSAMSCTSCHQVNIHEIDMATCVNCHGDHDPAFMDNHLTRFGNTCMDCHDGVDRMHDFDHSVFRLDGRHAEVECTACHIDRQFKDTPQACVDCHAEPEIHAGFFGVECQLCHTTSGWIPAQLRDHSFPLDHGGQGEIACQTCHLSTYTQYTCYGCHEHDPADTEEKHLEEGISKQELQQCAACHPTGQEDEAESGD